MKLTLRRKRYTDKSTIGELLVNGVIECFTLEDHYPTPYVKTPGKTAIPEGTYPVAITNSPRFSKLAGHPVDLPLVCKVPGFEGVRIHPGNTAADTEGCILVGVAFTEDRIEKSRLAYAALLPKLEAAIARGELVTLTVERAA